MAYLILLVSLFFSHKETAFLKPYSKSISKLHFASGENFLTERVRQNEWLLRIWLCLYRCGDR
jgi:hypothetical protein